MWRVVLFLIFTLIIVPLTAFQFDTAPTVEQKEILFPLIWVYLSVSLATFLLSTLTKNYSQVDKLWSLMPLVYSWMVAVYTDFDGRITLMAVLVTLWGLRLSYNFLRRGGYQWRFWEGEEDYRWAVLMAKPEFQPHWRWVLFNFFFISFYQLGLILLFTLPIVKCIGGGPMNIYDYIIAFAIIVAIIIETIADQQQWIYQNDKHRALKGEIAMTPAFEKGFTHTGLWGIVRHPNYSAEQAIWIIFYLFSISASGIWVNWSITGCLLLILLFKGSSDFSEDISKSKYPTYADYIKDVPRFIPWL